GGTAVPLVNHLAGDDVHDAADGVRAVERGHRATDNLDALDGFERGHVHELAVAEVVGTDVADVALTATIDQDQGVVCRQPSHGDADVAVLVLSAAHIDTFNVTKGIRKTGIRFGLQLVTA